MNEIEKLKESARWEIERINRRVEMLDKLPIKLVKQAFPIGNWNEFAGSCYQFTMPMNFVMENDFKEFCRVQGFEVKNWQRHIWDGRNAGDFCDVYVTDDVYFYVAFRSERTGSTCVLKKIGEEMKPIFEAVCTEGAAEAVK